MLRQLRRERGQDLIEYALVLPILMGLLLAIVQFGLIIYSYTTISDAARTASRWGVIGTRSDIDLVGIEERAYEVTRAARLSDADVVADATKVGSAVRVEVTYTMDLIAWLTGSPTITLRAVSTKQIELD